MAHLFLKKQEAFYSFDKFSNIFSIKIVRLQISNLFMKQSLFFKAFLCASICLILGIASGFSTTESIQNWYIFIKKPSWNPPNWIFGPVWTTLYICMGIALGIVWHNKHLLQKKAIIFFIFQFVLNLCWSAIFFNFHQLGLAFVEIIIMLFMIATTIYYFYQIKKVAGFLLIPYLLWVSFATILNGTIWQLNS